MGKVGPVARALGFAGLLPQLFATGLLLAARVGGGDELGAATGALLAVIFTYPLVILSFLGGTWWTFAMRRTTGQGRLAAVAVAPSLFTMAAVVIMSATSLSGGLPQIGWWLVAIGSVVALTLLVDRRLVATGEAPEGWMSLRVPLSLGLGGLTVLAGAVIGGPVTYN